MELKNIIGRGQHFGDDSKVTEKLSDGFTNKGFEVLESKDFLYQEYYKNTDALIGFLHQVPIFDDFSKDDYPHVHNYCDKQNSQKPFLSRHRVVFLARLN